MSRESSPWAVAEAAASGARQLCKIVFGVSGYAHLAWSPLGRNDNGVAVKLPEECGAILLQVDGNFDGARLVIETSPDGVEYHAVMSPMREPGLRRLNVRPAFLRPVATGGTYSTLIFVSLVAQRAT